MMLNYMSKIKENQYKLKTKLHLVRYFSIKLRFPMVLRNFQIIVIAVLKFNNKISRMLFKIKLITNNKYKVKKPVITLLLGIRNKMIKRMKVPYLCIKEIPRNFLQRRNHYIITVKMTWFNGGLPRICIKT